jgi:hypothetical protein
VQPLSMTKGQQTIREWAGVITESKRKLPTFPGVYPYDMVPVVHNQSRGRELAMARRGMPTPSYVLLKGKLKGTDPRSIRDPGTTNNGIVTLETVHSVRLRRAMSSGTRFKRLRITSCRSVPGPTQSAP